MHLQRYILLQIPLMSAYHYSVGKVTIDIFPEDILLEIFGFGKCGVDDEEKWEILGHVCRRWQSMFSAPLRLNLRLVCTHGTPVRKM